MFRFAVFAAFITLSVATSVEECASEIPFPNDVRIKGCDTPPCIAVKGDEAHMQVDFTPEKLAKTLNTKVVIHAMGWTFDYELPEEKGNVCKNLVGGNSCPLAANETATYDLSFPVDKDLPSVNAYLQISIVDENSDRVACFGFAVRVVDA